MCHVLWHGSRCCQNIYAECISLYWKVCEFIELIVQPLYLSYSSGTKITSEPFEVANTTVAPKNICNRLLHGEVLSLNLCYSKSSRVDAIGQIWEIQQQLVFLFYW